MEESLDCIQKLYVQCLRELHSAELQVFHAMPALVDAARSGALRQAMVRHREQTCGHVQVLEGICDDMAVDPSGDTSFVMEGLLRQAAAIAAIHGDPTARDAGLIGALQKVEHFEMASYAGARTFARLLCLHDHAEALQMILDEEQSAEELLTELAETMINARSADGKSTQRPYVI
jgi:ferritin-like metal-binding protein YciE